MGRGGYQQVPVVGNMGCGWCKQISVMGELSSTSVINIGYVQLQKFSNFFLLCLTDFCSS